MLHLLQIDVENSMDYAEMQDLLWYNSLPSDYVKQLELYIEETYIDANQIHRQSGVSSRGARHAMGFKSQSESDTP